MAIIRKHKTSVGTSLPRNPRDKDIAINSLTGEVKVYSDVTSQWSAVGDGTGAAIPEAVGTNDGEFLKYDGSQDAIVWAPVNVPSLAYDIHYTESDTGMSYIDNVFNIETAMANLVSLSSDGALNRKHLIFILPTGAKVDTVLFTGDSIGAVNPFLNAEFRVTVYDPESGSGSITTGPNAGFGIFKGSINLSQGSTRSFQYYSTGSSDFLFAW